MVRGFSPVACDPSRVFETKKLRFINATASPLSYSRIGPAQQCRIRLRFRSSACIVSGSTQSGPSWHLPTARPNPSLKRSTNGKPPGPVRGEVHSPQPGPGGLPLVPA